MKPVCVALTMLIIFALASCVNVTTKRRSASVSHTPDGGYARSSGARAGSYAGIARSAAPVQAHAPCARRTQNGV